MRRQRTYFTLTVAISILVGIILPLALGVRDPTLIAVTFSSVWFFYAVLLLITTFLIKPGLRIKASRQNKVTVLRYELLNAGKEEVRKSQNRIPDEVLKEIFPTKIRRSLGSERVYVQLRKMMLSGKLKRGKRLYREKIAQDFDVGYTAVSEAFSRLKRDGLVIIKHSVGSFVA